MSEREVSQVIPYTKSAVFLNVEAECSVERLSTVSIRARLTGITAAVLAELSAGRGPMPMPIP